MKRAVVFLVTMLLGTAVAAGVAWLVHLIFPRVAIVVFVMLTLYWLWNGWRYAIMRDKIEGHGSELSRMLEHHVAARMNETILALGATLERAEQERQQQIATPPRILLFLPIENQGSGLAELLENWGYSAKPVSTVPSLLGALETHRHDLLILDLCDSYVEVHVNDMLKLGTKVLFLGCDRHVHGILLPSGFNDFLEKPLDPQALRDKLRDLLGETGSRATVP